MRKRRIDLTTQYIVIVCMLLLIINVVLGVVLMSQSGQSMTMLVRRHMMAVSDTTAACLDGDILGSLKEEDIGSEEYNSVIYTLTEVTKAQKDNDIKYIYTVRKSEETGKFVFVVDPDPNNPGLFNEEVVSSPSQEIAWGGTSSVDEAKYTDRWGSFYTAWSPVRDSSGKVVALVGVDFVADWYDQQIADHTRSVIIIGCVSLAIGAAIMLLLMGQLRRRFRKLDSELLSLSGDVEKLSNEIRDYSNEETRPDSSADNEQSSDTIGEISSKIQIMQRKLKDYVEYTHEMAFTDTMTGVGNKTAYLDYIKEINNQINNGTGSFAIAVFDINGLKSINDNYGHECGDHVIIDAAAAICKVFDREQIFRIGGDEFIAVLPETSMDELKSMFEELNEAVNHFNSHEKKYAMTVSLSMGGTVYRPGKDSDFKEVFKRADVSMYKNKSEYYKEHGDYTRQYEEGDSDL